MDGDFDINKDRGNPFILKYQLTVESQDISKTLRKLQAEKEELLKNEMSMDVIWEIKTDKETGIANNSGSKSLKEICLNYIKERCPYPKSGEKLFNLLESKV
jgi:hypothetical protein